MINQHFPKIRFKGFGNNWKIGVELNDTIRKQFKGKAKQEQLGEGAVMYLDANTLSGDTPFMSNAETDTDSKDVLIMWDGSNAGRVFTGFSGALGSTLKGYKIKNEYNSAYIYYYLIKHQQKIYEQYRTPNIPHVIKNFTEVFKVSLPSLPEQSAIGTLFQTLDELLSAYKDNLANYQAFKATMLSKMFPKAGQTIPEIRLEGFDGEWEEKRLGDVSESIEYGLNASAKKFDGENKYLRITDIDDVSREFIQNGITSPDIDITNLDNYLLRPTDVLFARTGASVGKSYLYKESDGKVYFAGFLIRVRISEEYDANFVFQNTLTRRYKNFIDVTSQRSGQPGVNGKEYGDFKIFFPLLDEQQAIGSFFSNLDDLISSYQEKIEQLETLKKKLLQDMFV